MRRGFLIYEQMQKYFHIYEEAVSHIWLCNCSTLNFLIYEENLIFFFISVHFTGTFITVAEMSLQPFTVCMFFAATVGDTVRGLQRDVVHPGWPIAPLYSINQWVHLYTGAQINFEDLTSYLTYGYGAEIWALQVRWRCSYIPVLIISEKWWNVA